MLKCKLTWCDKFQSINKLFTRKMKWLTDIFFNVLLHFICAHNLQLGEIQYFH